MISQTSDDIYNYLLWIQHDGDRFRPLWLLFLGYSMTFLKDGIAFDNSFFFLTMYHFSNKNIGFIGVNYLNSIWIKFSIIILFFKSFFN